MMEVFVEEHQHGLKERNGVALHQLIGQSMVPLMNGKVTEINEKEGMGWELFEMKAYIHKGWKLIRLPQPFGNGNWELYNLQNDPAETVDLGSQFPAKRDSLIAAWMQYAQHNKVFDHRGHFDSLYRRNYRVDED